MATVLELAWKESAFIALVARAVVAPGHTQRMQVAAGLGAGPWHRMSRVLAPTAAPALAVSSLVTLVYAVGSYEVAWLLGRASPEPLPVLAFRLFGSIELTDRPAAAAAAVTGAVLALCLAAPALAALPRVRLGVSAARRALVTGALRVTARAGLGVVVTAWLVFPLLPVLLWSSTDRRAFPAALPLDWGLTGWRDAGCRRPPTGTPQVVGAGVLPSPSSRHPWAS